MIRHSEVIVVRYVPAPANTFATQRNTETHTERDTERDKERDPQRDTHRERHTQRERQRIDWGRYACMS